MDLFKSVNDTFGHATGDMALRMVADVIRTELRESDYVSRYGGDEFYFLLPESNEEQAGRVAEKIRANIEKQTLSAGDRDVPLKVTIGVAEWKHNIQRAHGLFDLADQALLTAKQIGRNRVLRFSQLTDVNVLDRTSGDEYRGMLSSVVAHDVMTSPVVCLGQDKPLRHAADLFLRMRITSAPVVDDSSKLIGVVSERDLLNATVSHLSWEACIREVMRTDVVSYEEHAPVMDIWEFLRRATTRRVVIVQDGVPHGVISRGSLLRWLGNWGMLRSDRMLTDSDGGHSQLKERARMTASEISRQMEQFQSELASSCETVVPSIINAATRLQEHAQEMLTLCQIQYAFEPALAQAKP